MENEVSQTFELGVTLMAISIVIALVAVTVSFGKDLKNEVFNEFNHSNNQVASGTLSSLNGVSTELPSAGAYNILKTYTSMIEKTTCNIDGCREVTEGLNSEPCIAKHLKGKVGLEVRKNSRSSNYVINIHKQDCKWYTQPCKGQDCIKGVSGCSRHGAGGSCTCR